jgi:hypothetical protein
MEKFRPGITMVQAKKDRLTFRTRKFSCGSIYCTAGVTCGYIRVYMYNIRTEET